MGNSKPGDFQSNLKRLTRRLLRVSLLLFFTCFLAPARGGPIAHLRRGRRLRVAKKALNKLLTESRLLARRCLFLKRSPRALGTPGENPGTDPRNTRF